MEREPTETATAAVVCIVRLWLPDLPGTLGRLATRIGDVGGDVLGIDILERGGGRAVDELTVALPAIELVDTLVLELSQLQGVAVEDVRVVASEPPDAGTLALGVAARLAEARPEHREELLCSELLTAFGAEWAALVDDASCQLVHSLGPCPDLTWLMAFLAGSRHLDPLLFETTAPSDIAWSGVGGASTVVIGRHGAPFHSRERTQLHLVGRIAAALTVPSPVG